ncbi:hypothetical protein FQR65_LT20315 [Abscondita terminalis]|nr:hypothetical protein FQR65_LT20315 [Abscondita terminalis]
MKLGNVGETYGLRRISPNSRINFAVACCTTRSESATGCFAGPLPWAAQAKIEKRATDGEQQPTETATMDHPKNFADEFKRGLKLLELSRVGARYQVESYAVETLPANAWLDRDLLDPEQVGQAIARGARKAGCTAKSAALALTGSMLISKRIELAAGLSDEAIEHLLAREAAQYIPYPLEEVALDFEVLGPAPGDPARVQALLVACRKEQVESREAALALAGLRARVVEARSQALERSFALLGPELADASCVALLDIGATLTILSVLHQGQVIYGREQLFLAGRQLSDAVCLTLWLVGAAGAASHRAWRLARG